MNIRSQLNLFPSQKSLDYREKLEEKLRSQNEIDKRKSLKKKQLLDQKSQYPNQLKLKTHNESRPGDLVISGHLAGDLVISDSCRHELKQQIDQQKVEQLRQQEEQNKGYVWFVRCENPQTRLNQDSIVIGIAKHIERLNKGELRPGTLLLPGVGIAPYGGTIQTADFWYSHPISMSRIARDNKNGVFYVGGNRKDWGSIRVISELTTLSQAIANNPNNFDEAIITFEKETRQRLRPLGGPQGLLKELGKLAKTKQEIYHNEVMIKKIDPSVITKSLICGLIIRLSPQAIDETIAEIKTNGLEVPIYVYDSKTGAKEWLNPIDFTGVQTNQALLKLLKSVIEGNVDVDPKIAEKYPILANQVIRAQQTIALVNKINKPDFSSERLTESELRDIEHPFLFEQITNIEKKIKIGIAFCKKETKFLQDLGAKMIANLACNDANQEAIAAAGGI